MLKIRMQRTGRINMPSFRIVVVEHTASPKAGSFVDKIGTYNPKTKERNLDAERAKYWMSVGAKPSATVHNMLVSLGVLDAKKINVLPKYKEPAKEEMAAAAPTPEGIGVPASSTESESVGKPTEALAAPAEGA